ncbi:MAG: mono/diheme cytochrome c family protein, partial [Verrucomicrobiales bacterium]
MNRIYFIVPLTAFALASARAEVDFDKDVKPIFASNCYKCHGEKKQKGELRLDSPAMIRKSGDSGEPVFLAGKGVESHLIKLVSRIDPDDAMPPEGKGDPLSEAQVTTLRTWIDEGAKMPGDGGAVVKMTTDHWSFEPVSRKGLENKSIDEMVIEKMATKGLTPSLRADRRTLIRRLFLVIHGMPPTSAEVAEFLADKAPEDEAWEKLVDRALASPRYGERIGRRWLDVVRFAESNGFETNRERLNAYHFRDYVIDSFNRDKPYDQFIKDQIAGDALGAEIGTGFLVAGAYDIVKSPDINLTLMQRQNELDDMVNTTGTTFLGLTIGCARCHNHKFDPISQKDYYAFQAVFAGISYGDRSMKKTVSDEGKQEAAKLRMEVAVAESGIKHLKKLAAANAGVPDSNLRPPVNAILNIEKFAPTEAKFVRFTIRKANASQVCIDELIVIDGGGKNVALGAVPTASGSLAGVPIHKLEHINDGQVGNKRSWICDQSSGWVQLEFDQAQRIERIEWARDRDGGFADRIATDYVIEGSLDGENWQALASSIDRQPFGGKVDPNAFVAKLKPVDAEAARKLIAEIAKKNGQITALETGSRAWIANFSQPAKTHRLYRGDPMAKREEVAPDALEVMGTLGMSVDEVEQNRRVKVAEWIANKENPLTSRVMANRLWQLVFGTGIVDTPSDFGVNGTMPTHPELLDWLAVEFMENGWSSKGLLRLMLTSQTFQQSSDPRPAPAKIDSGGRYLWRFPPRRLEAEAIRDSILA